MVELPALLERCKAGDALAWEAFVSRFQGRIYGIASAYTNHSEAARDLAQDIFVRLYETRRRWPDADRFMPWLVRTARNLAVDFLRRRRARTTATEVDLDAVSTLAEAGADPESLAIDRGRRSLVWRALHRLSALSRETMILREIQGLTLEEVASTLGVPVGTVKSRTSRARVELAQQVLALSQSREPDRPSDR